MKTFTKRGVWKILEAFLSVLYCNTTQIPELFILQASCRNGYAINIYHFDLQKKRKINI